MILSCPVPVSVILVCLEEGLLFLVLNNFHVLFSFCEIIFQSLSVDSVDICTAVLVRMMMKNMAYAILFMLAQLVLAASELVVNHDSLLESNIEHRRPRPLLTSEFAHSKDIGIKLAKPGPIPKPPATHDPTMVPSFAPSPYPTIAPSIDPAPQYANCTTVNSLE